MEIEIEIPEALVMPAKKPHSVYAPENFKWMLTVIFPHNN